MPYSTTLTPQILEKFLSPKDRRLPDQGESIVARAFEKLRGPPWTMPLRRIRIRSFAAYQAQHRDDYILLRAADANIRQLTRVKQSDRNTIITTLLCLLREGSPFSVFRTDIRSFYESIPVQSVTQRLNSDLGVPRSTTKVVTSLFQGTSALGAPGLPRGIGLSATLSEDFMRGIDRQFLMKRNVFFFYARFVDDIIVVTPPDLDKMTLSSIVQEELCKKGQLKLNEEKTHLVTASPRHTKPACFDFLGYSFSITPPPNKRNDAVVEVDISSKKVRRIKTRLCRAANAYVHNHDFDLLLDRIRILTGNYTIYDPRTKAHHRAGIFYGYPHITAPNSDSPRLKELDDFFHILFRGAATPLSRKVAPLIQDLPAERRNALLRYSFRSGHHTRRMERITPTRLREIRRCWQND